FSANYVPFDAVFSTQRSASVNVILEAKGPISPFLPGKFPHCIQAGKPILLLGPYYSECRRLLGNEHRWWSEIDDEQKILEHLVELFDQWQKTSVDNKEDYSNLEDYLSFENLDRIIQDLKFDGSTQK